MECTKTSKNKILQKEKNSTLIGREKDTRISDKVTNSQSDTIRSLLFITQTDIQVDQPNKKAIKKSILYFKAMPTQKKITLTGRINYLTRSCEQCEKY